MRLLRRIQQREIAEALGVTVHTISNWENGRREAKLTIRQTKALCKVLGCTLDDLPDDLGPQPIPKDN